MKLLLDTHVFIWWRADPRRIDRKVERAISRATMVYVSAASAWEAAIKSQLGKLRFPGSFGEAVAASQFTRLAISFEHAEAVSGLPLHHVDPFDRLLVAQARLEGLTVVSADRQLEPYRVPMLWT
jgi:PIN domain nuclease of toxin-antitoxin system